MKGFFAIGVHHSKNAVNIGTLWRTANILGAAYIYTVGRRYDRQCSDTMNSHRTIPLFHFETAEDLRQHLPYDCPLVGVELDATAQYSCAYHHPERACYLLGSEDNGLPASMLRECHALIRLPGERSLNVAVAGSLVLYDRWRQYSAPRVIGGPFEIQLAQ